MRFVKLLERFFPKVLIGIWLNKGRYYISVKRVLPSGGSKSETASFDADVELEEFFSYLGELQQNNIVTYIAVLDQSPIQGAIPTVDNKSYLDFKEVEKADDFDDIIFKPQYGTWSLFSLKTEIIHIQNRFQQSGLDYIFSPFLLPIAVKKRFQLPQSTSIYIISEKEFTIFSIFKDNTLLYGVIADDIDENERAISTSQNEIESDDIFSFGELDSDIEKSERYKSQSNSAYFDEGELDLRIDTFDEMENGKDDLNFKDELLDISMLDESEFKEDEIIEKDDDRLIKRKNKTSDLEKFLEEDLENEILEAEKLAQETEVDYPLVYETIKMGVHSFYNEKVYPSDFIENCYILTSLKVTNSFIQKVESEFSFETEKIIVDISELLVDLIGEELGRGKA